MVAFTVAICTYNGENRLPAVLDKLRSQVHDPSLTWEVIVIDNNSTDNTAKVVQDYQLNWSLSSPLRYCFEAKQGLAFARQCAIEQAQGELVGFLDDDNLPEPDWITAAFNFAQIHPRVAAYGSHLEGKFEVLPPENFHRIAPFLALIQRGSIPLCYLPQRKVLPPGAGLVIRKQVWRDTVPNPKCLTLHGRIGNSFLAGEDLEALLHLQQAGWEIWHNPHMRVQHCIPRQRLESDYLLRLFRGIGLSRHRTRMLSVHSWQRPFMLVAYFFNDCKKVVLHLLKYKQAVRADLVTACELELYLSSLISPIYLWLLIMSRSNWLENLQAIAHFFVISGNVTRKPLPKLSRH